MRLVTAFSLLVLGSATTAHTGAVDDAIRCATLIGSCAVARRIFNHILPNPEIWVQHFSIAPIFMRVGTVREGIH